MADRWIVSSFPFHEHRSREAAEQEATRLREKYPAKRYHVMRVKTTLKPSNAEAVIDALVSALVPLIGAAADRAAQLRAEDTPMPGGRAALESAAEAWGRLADAGAYALAKAHEPNGLIGVPIDLTRVPVPVHDAAQVQP